MKHNLIIMVMLFTSLPTFSQYVELPAWDLYDTETMISSINAARAAADVDNELARTLMPVIKNLRAQYHNGEYQKCKVTIDDIFGKITFYKRQYWIYSHLYYLRGMCLMKLGYEDFGIQDLVKASDSENEDAEKALQNFFSQYSDMANQRLVSKRYYESLTYVEKALSTTYYNYIIYEIGGQAYEGMNYFDDAKKYYNLAKKNGSPSAKARLKELKLHKKTYTQQPRDK
nr:hypothetical protein [uncultured Prevotella sp.]